MTTAFDSLMSGITITPPAAPTAAAPALSVPNLALPLLDYQVEAVQHIINNDGVAYNALDMGLGKTPVGLAAAAAAVAAGHRPALIVVPPSLRTNWLREAEKFTPWLTTALLTGAKSTGDPLPDVDLLIMGDSQVAGWADAVTGKVGALIVDEAHRFKNKSKRTEAMVQIATGTKSTVDAFGRKQKITVGSAPVVRVPMSGTPAPNGRHTELATQIDILGDDAWRAIGGKGMFWHRYAPKVDQYGTRTNAHEVELNEAMVNSWLFRRLRDNVVDLPNKGRTSLHLEARGRAVKEYIDAENNLIDWLAGKQEGKVSEGQMRAEALIRLNVLRRLAGEAKVRSVVEHVSELLEDGDSGVFVVAEHSDVIDGLLIGLAKYNPTVVAGGMTDREKDENVQAFITGESKVLIGQVTAAGVGLTLHGDGRNRRVVVAQLPWTPADLRQCEDRLHRLGQTRDVLVEVALCAIEGRWNIDERLWGMLEGKNFSATSRIDGEGEFLLDNVQSGILDSYR